MMKYLLNPLFVVASFMLVAYGAVGVMYFGLIFTHFSRWLFLVILVVLLLLQGRLFLAFRGKFGLVVFLFLAWCFATVLWSDERYLSFYKVTAYCLTAVAGASVGYWWASGRPYEKSLYIFVPLGVLCACAVILGFFTEDGPYVRSGSVNMFRGLTNNSNLMGILLIMAWPVALWWIERKRKDNGKYFIALGIGVMTLLTALASNSRASIGAIALCVVVYLYFAGLRRYSFLIFGGIGLIAAITVVNPELVELVEKRFVYKSDKNIKLENFFDSREDQFEASFRKAKAGGYTGFGFGVSAGMERLNEFDPFSASRSREKGNTALAVVEETGVLGFVLYLLVIATTITIPIRAALLTSDYHLRVLLGIVAGTLVGLTFNSQFEAWWIAPGGAATPYFWCLAGVSLALARKARSGSRGSQRHV